MSSLAGWSRVHTLLQEPLKNALFILTHTNSHCLYRPGRIWKARQCSQRHMMEQGTHCCGVWVLVLILAVELFPTGAAALLCPQAVQSRRRQPVS